MLIVIQEGEENLMRANEQIFLARLSDYQCTNCENLVSNKNGLYCIISGCTCFSGKLCKFVDYKPDVIKVFVKGD